jgi:hypothetical protein
MAGFSFAEKAFASNANFGFITQITHGPGGVILVVHTGGDRTGIPTCAEANPGRWAFNVNTPAGQSMLATILTVYSTGKRVNIGGSGACGDWGDTENIIWLNTEQN